MALNYTFIELPQGGRLALSERPKIKEITSLRADCTHMVTLLAAKVSKHSASVMRRMLLIFTGTG